MPPNEALPNDVIKQTVAVAIAAIAFIGKQFNTTQSATAINCNVALKLTPELR